MEDKQIVELYWARSESAISETEKKYGRYCHYIAYRILENDEDAKEVVNDTYLKAWNTIPPACPVPLKPYLGTISRQLALNVCKSQNTQKRGGQVPKALDELAECVPENGSALDPAEQVHLRDTLGAFLSSLPQKTRRIFLGRYWYNTPLSELANTYGMRENAVANLLLRTRKKLKQTLEKEGFFV